MTFAEITERRLQIAQTPMVIITDDEDSLPAWLRASLHKNQSQETIIYQRCGGGRRIIKKRIGGN